MRQSFILRSVLILVIFLGASQFQASASNVRGDINNDRYANITDVTYLINNLLHGETQWTMDVNCDGRVNISDVTALINYLLSGDWPWSGYYGPAMPDNAVIYTVNGYRLVMVPVESGTFMMGSERGDEQASPVHQVTLSSYSIGLTEVTFGLWNAVMGSYPFDYSPAMDTDNSPVWFCSRDNAQEFIDALNALTGLDFHLPTEAQWEFAARGGNLSHGYLYAGSDELFEVGWIEMNEKGRIHEVGLLKPNELGLYDMSGNVREYCEDDYYNYSSVPQVDPSGLWTPYSPPMMVFRGAGEGSVSGGYTVTSRRDCWVARASHSQEIWGVGFRLAL